MGIRPLIRPPSIRFRLLVILAALLAHQSALLAQTEIRTRSIDAIAMAFSSQTQLLYLTTSSASVELPGSFVALSPSTGDIAWSLTLPGSPRRFSLHPETPHAFVWLADTNTVVKISLDTRQEVACFPLPASLVTGNVDIQALPGGENRFAITAGYSQQGPRLYDGAAQLPRVGGPVDNLFGIDRIVLSSDSQRVIGVHTETSAYRIAEYRILPDGLSLLSSRPGLITRSEERPRASNGRIFLTNGFILAEDSLLPDHLLFGLRSPSSPAMPVPARNRVYYAVNTPGIGLPGAGFHLFGYDMNSGLLAEDLHLPNLDNASTWGENAVCGDVLALALPDHGLHLIAIDAIPPVSPQPLPQPQASAESIDLALGVNHLVYSPSTQRIYATIPSWGSSYGNAIAEIHPDSGQILRTVPVGSQPQRMALSADGRFLYVGLQGRASVVRLNLPNLDAPRETRLIDPATRAPLFPAWLEAAPDGLDRIAVSAASEPAFPWIGFYLGGRLAMVEADRVTVEPSALCATALAFAGASDRVFAYCSQNTSHDLHELHFASGTWTPIRTTREMFRSGTPVMDTAVLKYVSGALYTDAGVVVDGDGVRLRGSYPFSGSVAVDPSRNRVYFLRHRATFLPTTQFNDDLLAFDLSKFTLTEGISLFAPEPRGADLTLAGNNHLAFRRVSGGGIRLVPLSVLRTAIPNPAPTPESVGSLTAVFLPIQDIAYHPATRELIGSVPGAASFAANSLVRMDATTGAVKGAHWIGSEPGPLAMADDGRSLHVGLWGSSSVVTWDAAARTASPQSWFGSIGNAPGTLLAEPGTAPAAYAIAGGFLYRVPQPGAVAAKVRDVTGGYRGLAAASDRRRLFTNLNGGVHVLDLQPGPDQRDLTYLGLRGKDLPPLRLTATDGLLIDETGLVIDERTMEPVTRLNRQARRGAAYAVDTTANRILEATVLSGTSRLRLRAHSRQDFLLREQQIFDIPGIFAVEKLLLLPNQRFAMLVYLRVGEHPAAYETSAILLGSWSQLPQAPSQPPVLETLGNGLRRLSIEATAAAYDDEEGRLYLAAPEQAKFAPGQIVPFDPVSGTLGAPFARIPGIERLWKPPGGRELLIATRMGNRVVRWDLRQQGVLSEVSLGAEFGIPSDITVPPSVTARVREAWDVLPLNEAAGGLLVSTRVTEEDRQSTGLLRTSGSTVVGTEEGWGFPWHLAADTASGSLYRYRDHVVEQLTPQGTLWQATEIARYTDRLWADGPLPAFAVSGNTAYIGQAACTLPGSTVRHVFSYDPIQVESVAVDIPRNRWFALWRSADGTKPSVELRWYELSTGALAGHRQLTTYDGLSFPKVVVFAPCGADCFSILLHFLRPGTLEVLRSELYLVDGVSGSTAPVISPQGVVHGASFLHSPLAPGTIFSIFGNRLGPESPVGLRLEDGKVSNELGGTRVRINGQEVPLLYVSRLQVNAIVPYWVPVGAPMQITVETPSGTSPPVPVPTEPTSLAVFTRDASGTGLAAALNQDFSVNSPQRPARRGEVIMVYGTGGGLPQTEEDAGALAGDRLWFLHNPVGADIAGIPAQMEYAGSAPTLVNGVNQFNIRIPQHAPTGDAVPLFLNAGSPLARNLRLHIAIAP
jgi:uncharacterized protein (TIGR03437 family)